MFACPEPDLLDLDLENIEDTLDEFLVEGSVMKELLTSVKPDESESESETASKAGPSCGKSWIFASLFSFLVNSVVSHFEMLFSNIFWWLIATVFIENEVLYMCSWETCWW